MGFAHFDYVNPTAPKGGIYHTWSLGSFNSLTPFTEKGNATDGAWDIFDKLMVGILDTRDQMYGLIADSASLSAGQAVDQLHDAAPRRGSRMAARLCEP